MLLRLHFWPTLMALFLLVVATPALGQGMRIVDLPLFEGATDVSYMKRRGDVRYKIQSDFKTVGNYYAQKLAELQWRKNAKQNLQRNFWVQSFSKGNATLEVRVDTRGGGSEVRLTPKGMMWEEDDQPSPKDLPIPEQATQIEYDDFFESIEFKTPSDVKTVANYLSTELEKRKWTKTATEFDLESFVRIKFTYDKSSLTIDVRGEDEGGCEVAIRTDSMQWDGMKAEVARSKIEAEKRAAEEEKQQEAEEAQQKAEQMAASLQQRRERPKQGIEKLPELPSQATVVMDGQTYKLTHVIAYEIFEYDEWKTKIVATQKPVKQQSLLAKLKQTGTDQDADENPQTWPEPHLIVVLDKDDRPTWLNLRADGTPGSGSSDELQGEALVESGRARGTVKLKEPGDFFDKVYTGEISFDVPVLTRESTPAKRLADAPKLANSGKLTIGGKTYNLPNVVAYEMMFFDDPMTTVVLSQKPLNIRNLTASLGKEAADNYFEFTPQVKLLIDEDDNVSSISIWADNMSLGGNSDVDDNVVIEDGRARGTARMLKPGEAFDSKYNFDVSFDVTVLGKRPPSRQRPAGSLAADSYKGMPIPEGHEGLQSEGSPFRSRSTTTIAAELSKVVDFYRNEMTSGDWGNWQESTGQAEVNAQSAKMVFTGPDGGLSVQLRAAGKKTAITLVSRDAQAAKAAGLFPAAGKSRLFVANDSSRASAITINKQDYTIKAGAGATNPKTGFNWEVPPGKYTVEIKRPGGQVQSEAVELKPDSTMGVIIDAAGGFNVIELY